MAFKIRDGCSFRPFNSAAKNTLTRRKPPHRHLAVMMKGGLVDLYDRINRNLVEVKYETGTYTNTKDGVLVPDIDMPLLASRYKFVKILGKGQSSILFKAQDTCNKGSYVAIKALHTHYHMLGAQETECIRRLNAADPMCYSPTLRIKTVFDFDTHYCMVFELLSAKSVVDIFDRMSRKEAINNIRIVAKTVLTALGFLQQQNVIHADLKPENILLQNDNDLRSLKVVDFGNAIHCVHEELSLYYDDYELQTLLYRAPEVMFGCSFGLEIDIWSLGCILAELYYGKPIFSGRDKLEVIQKIVSLLGPIPEDLVIDGKFFSQLKQFTSKSARPTTVIEMKKNFPDCQDYAFIDFIMKLLKYRPNERMTVMEAACHPFLASELGTAFLFQKTNNSSGYPQVFLDEMSYKKKPVINIDIPHQKLSSIDFLRYGTGSQSQNSITNGRYSHSNQNVHRSSSRSSNRSKVNDHSNKGCYSSYKNNLHSPSLFSSSHAIPHNHINKHLSAPNIENQVTSQLHNLFGDSSFAETNQFSTSTPWLESLHGKSLLNITPDSFYQNSTMFSNSLLHNDLLRDSFVRHYESLNMVDKQIPVMIGLNKIEMNNNIQSAVTNNKLYHKLFNSNDNMNKSPFVPNEHYNINNLNFAKSHNDIKPIFNHNLDYSNFNVKDRKFNPFINSLIDVHSSGNLSNALNCIDKKCFPSVKIEPPSLSSSFFNEYADRCRSDEKALNVSTVSSTVTESCLENFANLKTHIKIEPEDVSSTGQMDYNFNTFKASDRKSDKLKKMDNRLYENLAYDINQSANVTSSCNDFDVDRNNKMRNHVLLNNNGNHKSGSLKQNSFSKIKNSNIHNNHYSESTSNDYDNIHLFNNSLHMKSASKSKEHIYHDSSNSSQSKNNHSTDLSGSSVFSDSMEPFPDKTNYCDILSSKHNVQIDPCSLISAQSNNDFKYSSNSKRLKKRKVMTKKDTEQISLRRTSRKTIPCNYTILSDDDLYSSDDGYSPTKFSKKSCQKKRLRNISKFALDNSACAYPENITSHNNAKNLLVLNW